MKPSSSRYRPFPLFTTLRGRLALLVCLTTLPTILFTVYVADNERSATLRRTEDDAHHLARLAAREHAHQIGGARSLLRWLGDRIAQDGERSTVTADTGFLPALLVGYPQLANIGILSAGGRVLQSAYPLLNFPNMRDNPAFVRALQSREVETGSYIIGPIVGRPVLNLAYAARGPGGAVRRVAFVALDLRWLGVLAEQVNLPPGYSLYVIDREGRVLAQSGAAGESHAAAVGILIPGLADLSKRQGGTALSVGEGRPLQFFVAAPMEEIPGVSVAVGLPYARIHREANRAFYRTLGSLILLTLFTVISVLVATELSILRALRTLSHTAKRFGAGELSARAVIERGHGELRELAGEFNAMADGLAMRHRELTEAHDRLRALSRHLQVARETEAGRIARDLHDEIGQVLTSLKIDLASLRRRPLRGTPSATPSDLDAEIARISERIDGAVDFVRRISSELRPAVLDRLGLAAALEWQARELEAHTDLTVEVEIRAIDEPIDWLVSITIFRIAQEAFTNVVRHAGATIIRVTLASDLEEIVLTVSDDGKGAKPEALNRVESFGVFGMRERARLVDGTLVLSGAPGQGTTVTVRIPRRRAEGSPDAHPVG